MAEFIYELISINSVGNNQNNLKYITLLGLEFKSLFQNNFQFGRSEICERCNTGRYQMFPMNLSVRGNPPNEINTCLKRHISFSTLEKKGLLFHKTKQ